jgi:hypothetical protein
LVAPQAVENMLGLSAPEEKVSIRFEFFNKLFRRCGTDTPNDLP